MIYLWDEIKLILPSEKLDKTVGRPVVPFEKYLKNYRLDYYKFIMIAEVFDGDGYRLIVFLSKLI